MPRHAPPSSPSAERARMAQDEQGTHAWRQWGPYLSERQWGTVREDYSANGDAWKYLTHDMARSYAYRWGEDGIAGFSDADQRLCFSMALWNEQDPILKERLFGLTNEEGNHGEDVKERYYYLDAVPSYAYAKMLYKYPQRLFPYADLVAVNRQRNRREPEYELVDTGAFDANRYFDVFVEFAKAAPDDVLIRVVAHNRGADPAPIHILPQLWFRNTWSWFDDAKKPSIQFQDDGGVEARHETLGTYRMQCDGNPTWIFSENETNVARLYGATNASPYVKDAFHARVIDEDTGAVNGDRIGTKAAAWIHAVVPPGENVTVRARLTGSGGDPSLKDVDAIFARRTAEANAYYDELQQGMHDADHRAVQRQALAGMLWNKQFYHYDVSEWIQGDPAQPPPPKARKNGRNADWEHLDNANIISMPDKWEYPWYAAWDLAFHTIPLALVDPEFAKRQLVLLTRGWYMHPNGQLPAYEWNFGDVNPPVHAWATWRIFQIDRKHRGGDGDLKFLERVFHKLLMNFTWWVNRKDPLGHNVFQGGFLGLDNIGIFDRSKPLPTGGYINQADGTSWMAMYCLNMMRIALELALHNPVYQDMATKFFEHFLYIAHAMTQIGHDGVHLWDPEDKFYYDALCMPDGVITPIKIRSMVGLIPLFAVETLEPECLKRTPEFAARMEWFLTNRPELASLVSRWNEPGRGERRLLSLLRGHRLKCLLRRMLDPDEFLSEFGVRSLSKFHKDHPFSFQTCGASLDVRYQPGESDSGLFGGNSNWRGPIWFPVNYLIIESLQRFQHYYGDDFKVEHATGSGKFTTLSGVAEDLTRRLCSIFLPGADGRRPLFGPSDHLQDDPLFREYLYFGEYFHGEDGRSLGAMQQTGWTGLVAKLLHPKREPTH